MILDILRNYTLYKFVACLRKRKYLERFVKEKKSVLERYVSYLDSLSDKTYNIS